MSTIDPRPTRAESPVRLTRRSLTLGAAWTAPLMAVSVAAPAYAASCVANYRLTWGTSTYNKNNDNLGTASVAPISGTASAVGVQFQSAINGSVVRTSENLNVSALTNVGGLGGRGLMLVHQQPITAGRDNRQTLTINFGRAVTGLTFSITDIDSQNENNPNNDWWDRVELSGTRNYVPASQVLGQGTEAAPWYYDDTDTNVANDAGAGNVRVTYPGAVTSITLVYWSTRSDSNQRIFLTDFTFSAACS